MKIRSMWTCGPIYNKYQAVNTSTSRYCNTNSHTLCLLFIIARTAVITTQVIKTDRCQRCASPIQFHVFAISAVQVNLHNYRGTSLNWNLEIMIDHDH